MNGPSFRPHTLLIGLAQLLLAVGGVAAVLVHLGLARSTGRIESSYQVIAGLDQTVAAARSVEATARSYRLTGRREDYGAFFAAEVVALDEADRLLERSRTPAPQAARAQQLRRTLLARLAESRRLVDTVDTPTGSTEIQRILQRGNTLTRQLIGESNTMRRAELRALRELQAANRRQSYGLIALVVAGTVLPMLLLVLLPVRLAREVRRVQELEHKSNAMVRNLETAVFVRDELVEQNTLLRQYATLLQTTVNANEAFELMVRLAGDLLPGAGGRCYRLDAAQERLETVMRFGTPTVGSAESAPPEDCWAMRRGQPHECLRDCPGARCPHLGPAAEDSDTWTVCIPLAAQGISLGLFTMSGHPSDALKEKHIEGLKIAAEQLSQTIANLRLRETLRAQSLRDVLTGLHNRRHLEENLPREIHRSQRLGQPLSLLMIDIDHFKRFNDAHGHAAGDAVLAGVGGVLAQSIRGEDIACRYGGEEFTLVLPEATPEAAAALAEEIRATIARTRFAHQHESFEVTVSIGVAGFPESAATPEQLLAAADTALYRAKNEGRNRVALA